MFEALPGTKTQNYTKPGVQNKLDLSLISVPRACTARVLATHFLKPGSTTVAITISTPVRKATCIAPWTNYFTFETVALSVLLRIGRSTPAL
jgi:hypothetical protein